MNPMITIGSLVNIVDPAESMTGLDVAISKPKSYGSLIGKPGVILYKYQHATATCGREWYTVLIDGLPRSFREDYLEAI